MFSRLASRARLAAAVAAVALVASAGTARADMVDFVGSRTGTDPVSFSGRLDLGPISGTGATTTAVLKITLTNTTTGANNDAVTKGYITGFGFNVPANVTASASKTGNFNFLTAQANATGLQGGEFDYAFSTNASQLHTVSSPYAPNASPSATDEVTKGLAAGQSRTFSVTLTGTGVVGLSAARIIDELSAPTPYKLSARFRSTNPTLYKGLNDPDGDKVAITGWTPVNPNPPTPGAVPAPPGVVLAGFGFGTMLLARLRRRS